MKYKGLVFDFDYTLGDSTEGIVVSTNYALEQLGYYKADRESIRKTIGLHLEEMYKVLTKEQGIEGKVSEEAEFARLFIEKADEIMTEKSGFYPGVLALMEQWKEQGYKLAIVTTKYCYRIEGILEKYKKTGLFDLIVGGDSVKKPKPDPEGILMLLRSWELPKEDILYVGDSLVDAKTAQAAGVDFAGVTTGTTTKEELGNYPNIGIFARLGLLPV